MSMRNRTARVGVLDNFDRKILRALQDNADVTVQGLAEKVGLSHTPCWRRLKKLEEVGAIAGRAVLLNPDIVGCPITVFAHLKLKQHDEETLTAFERGAQAQPEIVECFTMSGDSDYICRVVVASIDQYERFLRSILLHLPGVASCNSSFALKRVKLTTKLPI